MFSLVSRQGEGRKLVKVEKNTDFYDFDLLGH